jgi:hypothetical protein
MNVPKTQEELYDEFCEMATLVQQRVESNDGNGYDFNGCATRIDRNGPYHVEDVVAALFATKGDVSSAARLLARQRGRLKDYIDRNPMVLEYFNDLFQGTIDNIESNYLQRGLVDMGIARHILSTRARDRGWGETKHVDLTSSDGSMSGKDAEKFDLSQLTDEELEQYERLTTKAQHPEGEGQA